jgi:hypothetical protein
MWKGERSLSSIGGPRGTTIAVPTYRPERPHFRALDPRHVELADEVAEEDRVGAGALVFK